MKKSLITTSILALGITATPAAFASEIDNRGHSNCTKAMETEFSKDGLTVDRQIFIKKNEDQRIYFLNGYVWNAGDRARIRVACSTSSNGRKVQNFVSDRGEYYLDQGALASR